MPDNIIFNTIPTDIRTPGQYVEIDNSKALRGLPSLNRRILVVGNKLPTGTAAPLTLYRVNSGDEGATLFGRGSVLHEMLRLAHGQQDERYLGAECRRPRGRCRRYQDHHRHRPCCRRRHDRPLYQRSEARSVWRRATRHRLSPRLSSQSSTAT